MSLLAIAVRALVLCPSQPSRWLGIVVGPDPTARDADATPHWHFETGVLSHSLEPCVLTRGWQ